MIIDDHLHTVDQFRSAPSFIKGYVAGIERSYSLDGDGSVPNYIVRDLIKFIRELVS